MDHQYQPLKTDDELKIESSTPYIPSPRSSPCWKRAAFCTFLLISLLGNGASILQLMNTAWEDSQVDQSPYAKLPRNVQTTFDRGDDYISQNRTIADAAWSSVDINDGTIALPDTLAASFSLPVTQRFPWDHSKGLYLAASYHNLHCLRTIRKSVFEAHDGLPQSMHFAHLIHCLEILRQEVVCNADETPLLTGTAAQGLPGLGQARMCRDWSKLQDWLRQYNACYDHTGNDIPGYPEIEHFRNCPPGSPYFENSQTGP